MAKIWLPLTIRKALREKNKDMYKYLACIKNVEKQCIKCGKTELMQSKQKQCSDCIDKQKKITWKNTHCATCGRTSRKMFDVDGEKSCSFCMENRNKQRAVQKRKKYITKKRGVNTPKFCTECFCRIFHVTFLRYNGKCRECFEYAERLKKIEKEMESESEEIMKEGV